MGLVVNAYSKIQLIGTELDEDEWEEKYDWRNTVYIYPSYITTPEFPEQIKDSGLVAGGVYEYAQKHKFEAGPYSSYNEWRDRLSRLMLGAPAKTVWTNPGKYKDSPFYPIINFSDSEGIISGPTAKRLLANFISHRDKASTASGDWWRNMYTEWTKAFALAADNGFVSFD